MTAIRRWFPWVLPLLAMYMGAPSHAFVPVASRPDISGPPHKGKPGNVRVHFVRLKTEGNPDRLEDYTQGSRPSLEACKMVNQRRDPMPVDPDERYVVYTDHYISAQFHTVYKQVRMLVGSCELTWYAERSVRVTSANSRFCSVDLLAPSPSAQGDDMLPCRLSQLLKGPHYVSPIGMGFKEEIRRIAGHTCRHVQKIPAGPADELVDLCLLGINDMDLSKRGDLSNRGLMLRRVYHHKPRGHGRAYRQIEQALEVELGIGVDATVLLPYIR
jgi:hypothetical protein